MAKYIRAVKLPAGDLIAIENIMAVKRFDKGIGLLDMRNRMVGWVEIEDSQDADKHFEQVLKIFDDLINNRRRVEQPDWSFLTETPPSAQTGTKSKGPSAVTQA
jgi:hypothetical protein